MMFGEYLSALKDKDIWASTGITFDKTFCVSLLDQVKEIRNGVMHFSASSNDGTEKDANNECIVGRALRLLRAVPLQ